MDIENQPRPQKGATFLRTCFNGLNALSGIGILSIPYALACSGWLSLIILLSVAILCYYTGLLLQKCMDADPCVIKTYPDIGQFAFGKKGRFIISALMYLELYLVAVEFLILESEILHKLFPKVGLHLGIHKIGGEKLFVMVTALLILPATWLRNFRLLGYVSLGGVLSSLVLVGSVFWVGALDVGFHESGSIWRWHELPTTISLFTFCFCGHSVFPTLRTSMEDQRQFFKVLLLCYALSTVTYGLMGIFGYLMFGKKLASQVILNLPTKYISSKIAIYTTLVSPLTKYPIIVAPISSAIEGTSDFRNRMGISILIRTILVISTVIVALTIPFFEDVMAFIGAFLNTIVSIVFPCLCYLKIKKVYKKKFGVEFMIIMLILVFGVFVSVIGTYVYVKNIIEHVIHR